MKNVQTLDCSQPAATKLERVNYFNRQLLTADDMTTERDYFLQKLRRHNRFLHGWGVVCGLPITAAPVKGTPWRVQVGSGYALGPYGDEIFVGEAVYFDLNACLTGGTTNPCEPNMVTAGGSGTSTVAYLAIKYAECLARPVQVASSGCGCDSDPCQYSRILDSFSIQCLPQLPQPPASPPTLCQVVRGGVTALCPPCPTDPWVVLAKITLPTASSMNIVNSSIDNVSVRRVILSTAILQDQIVRCCCGPASSSSSSSSSSSAIASSSSSSASSLASGAILRIGQKAAKVAGAVPGTTQFTVVVNDVGGTAANDVVVTIKLSPLLSDKEFKLDAPAAAWPTASLSELKSAPISIPAYGSQTLTFTILAIRQTQATSLTSNAFATSTSSGISATASPLTITIGG